MRMLAIIPARAGSKGLPKKNIRKLNGVSLIERAIDSAKTAKYVTDIVVTTDDEDIIQLCDTKAVSYIRRPKDLAADRTPMAEAVLHALYNLPDGISMPDIFVLLQCTSPFRTGKHIDEAMSLYLSKKDDDRAVVSVEAEKHPPYWLKKVDETGKIKNFLEYDRAVYARRQDFETLYRLNGAIYVLSPVTFEKYFAFQTDSTYAYIMDSKASIDIDTEEDFQYAEFLCQKSILQE